MKYFAKLLYLSCMCSFLGCGGDSNVKTATETKTDQAKETSPSKQETNQTTSSGDGITGYWKLYLEAYDDNGNRKLDEEERKKGIQNHYTFRFNADGSCQIMDTFKGRYEMKTENNRKLLKVYRNRIVEEEEKDPPPDVYEIISMANNELTLLETLGDHTFWVFKRAG